VRKQMEAAGMLATWSKTPEEFGSYLAAESAKWKKVVQQINAAARKGGSH